MSLKNLSLSHQAYNAMMPKESVNSSRILPQSSLGALWQLGTGMRKQKKRQEVHRAGRKVRMKVSQSLFEGNFIFANFILQQLLNTLS